MTDALLAVARTEEGGVRTKHLERECARALSDSFALQSRLQEALARARAAEDQLMMIRPYALYGQSMSLRQRGGMGLGLTMPPNPLTFNPSSVSGSFSSGYKPANTSSKPVLSSVVIPSQSTATGPRRSTGSTNSETSDPSTASGSNSEKPASIGASNAPLRNSRVGGSPDSFEDLISAAQRALDSEISPDGQSTSREESQPKDQAPDSSQRERSRSALDVLVAVAFGDSAGEIDTSIVDSSATEPASSRKSEVDEDGSERLERNVKGASDPSKTKADTGKPTKKNPASFVPPTKSLPAFMSYAPDYKSVGSTSTSVPAANKLAYTNHPTTMRPYYVPPLPLGYGLPTYSPPKSRPGQSGLASNPFSYRGPVPMPLSKSSLGKMPTASSSFSQQSIWPVPSSSKITPPPQESSIKASSSKSSQALLSTSMATAPAGSLDRAIADALKQEVKSARKGKKRTAPQNEPDVSDSEAEDKEHDERAEDAVSASIDMDEGDKSPGVDGEEDDVDVDVNDPSLELPRNKRRRTNSSVTARTNPISKSIKAGSTSNNVSFTLAFTFKTVIHTLETKPHASFSPVAVRLHLEDHAQLELVRQLPHHELPLPRKHGLRPRIHGSHRRNLLPRW